MIIGGCSVFARNHDEIPTRLYTRQKFNAGGISQPALDTIAHHSVAHSLADGEAEATMLASRPPCNEHKPSVRPTLAIAPRRREIFRLSQAMLLLHIRSQRAANLYRGLVRQGCLSEMALHGELMPSPEHSTLQHIAAILGAHARSEAMHSHSSTLLGLIGSFRHLLLLPDLPPDYCTARQRFYTQSSGLETNLRKSNNRLYL